MRLGVGTCTTAKSASMQPVCVMPTWHLMALASESILQPIRVTCSHKSTASTVQCGAMHLHFSFSHFVSHSLDQQGVYVNICNTASVYLM
jgi:hypothetical protein